MTVLKKNEIDNMKAKDFFNYGKIGIICDKLKG